MTFPTWGKTHFKGYCPKNVISTLFVARLMPIERQKLGVGNQYVVKSFTQTP